MRDDIVLLVSRLLLAWIFLHEGAFLLVNYSASSAGMAKMGVPAFAPPLVIALQLIAGAAIAVGWYARCGAAAAWRVSLVGSWEVLMCHRHPAVMPAVVASGAASA